ncbi:MAG: DUF1624 domain-containing protein [Acidobacteria bacterium]|nr:DUF1624 domain-containing protein [Acidobacteriota bacterium]
MQRIESLDQFRGYTVAGMFLVNFIGSFAVVPVIFKHHRTYCSYADTIMPHFFFAVGFAFRLALLRNVERNGRGAAYRAAVRRCLGLILVGIVVHQLDGRYNSWRDLQNLGVSGFLENSFRRNVFQALVHIGVTSLWVLPVIGAAPRTMWIFLTASGLLHLGLSKWFWYDWLLANRVIDGGPLGFLTWTIPLLCGAIAYDWVRGTGQAAQRPLLRAAAALMVLGYGISCLSAGGVLAAPPFAAPWHPRDIWTMSQQAGSISYLVFSAGLSFLVYAFFLWWTDGRGRQWPLFKTLGTNALAGYILHGLVSDVVRPFAPRDSPGWYVALAFAVFFGITWAMVRSLEKQRIFIRL